MDGGNNDAHLAHTLSHFGETSTTRARPTRRIPVFFGSTHHHPILSNWFPLSTIPLVYIREEEMLARLWSLCSWKRYNNADYIYVVRIARTPVSFGTLDRGGAGQDIRYLQQVRWRIERQKRSRHCIDRWPCVRRKFGLRVPKRACSLLAVYLGRKGRSRAYDW